MSVAEVNFSFNGLHCLRDFGCIYIENDRRTVSPETRRNEYEIAGVSGTILLGDQVAHSVYTLTGTLVPMKSPESMQAAQELARRVSAWLKSGRGVLIWDYEPTQMHYAEVITATEWNTQAWMDGGLAITWQVQPYTYDLTPTVCRKTFEAGSNEMTVPVYTGIPCPVSVAVTNEGTSAITRVKISTAAGQVVEMSKGLSLAAGAVLRLNMDPPIGAAIEVSGRQTNALRHAVRFDQLTLSGPEVLTIEANGKIRVEATARGCAL